MIVLLKKINSQKLKKLVESTLICKNIKTEKIVNGCDDRNIKLDGNYLIIINNCTMHIFNESISNTNEMFIERFFYEEFENLNFTKELNFEEVVLEKIVNLTPIKLLKIHKNVQYVIGSTTIIFSLIVVLIFVNIVRKHKKLIISIKNIKEENCKALEESYKKVDSSEKNLKGGGVTSQTTPHIPIPLPRTLPFA